MAYVTLEIVQAPAHRHVQLMMEVTTSLGCTLVKKNSILFAEPGCWRSGKYGSWWRQRAPSWSHVAVPASIALPLALPTFCGRPGPVAQSDS